ncbi:uncharacterized protein LOC135682292 isoform X2 [Rhopilema esculentum]|uniref:uncharacterized protein LOC135682292 isoform X2 n=1 Tax=Rhopilema esculentum TaxID=499914 RepID=UPI0031D2ECDF
MICSKYFRNFTKTLVAVCILMLGVNFLQHYQFTNRIIRKKSSTKQANNWSTTARVPRKNDIQYITFGNELLSEVKKKKLNCEYPFIGKNLSKSEDENVKCKLVPPSEEDCDAAQRAYGDMPRDRTCHEGRDNRFADICRFANDSFRLSSDVNLRLQCDPSVCKNSPVYVGGIHPSLGILSDMEQWAVARGKNELVTTLNTIIKDLISRGIDFVFIGCKPDKKMIKQVLVLPPLLKLDDNRKNRRKSSVYANINILVLDSVSREHFFRRLPDTAKNLKQINRDPATNASVLDFELFQSLAPRTFPNIRALFSGVVDKDTDDDEHTYDIGNLFGEFIAHGYQTMLQEDSCWFDSWGAIITDNVHDLTPLTTTERFLDRWTALNKRLRMMQVNSFGLTHLTCEVLLRYGVTNQFNDPQKVCYNGKLLTTYFLDYVKSHFLPFNRQKLLKPLLLYTHLNTGHEKSGKRIAKSDPELSDFVTHAAKQDNTITLIMSDHGPKTTRFARDNDRGRYELAHSFLFMIIPDKIRTALGKQYSALVTNQKRLITPKDLHFTLTGLLQGHSEGLLQPIDPKRGCEDLPMYSFTHCLCSGWVIRLPDAERSVAWIAEFGLGYLNNLIQKMFTKETPNRTGGYGNCERLIGLRFINIKTRKDGNQMVYNFDIVVYRYRGAEMFEFAISEKINAGNSDELLKVLQWRRVSIFQHFRKCLDTGVLPDLCICRPESSGLNPGRDLTQLLSSKFYSVRTIAAYLDSRCLILLTRTRSKSHRAYEVTNVCVDRSYSFRFDLTRNALEPNFLQIAGKLPMNVTVYPWTTHFLTSISLRNYDDADITKAGKIELIKYFIIQ